MWHPTVLLKEYENTVAYCTIHGSSAYNCFSGITTTILELESFWVFLILYWVTACLIKNLGGIIDSLLIGNFVFLNGVERFFATCGALSAEYGPITWVGLHRQTS